jgi:hypothetical protein
VRRLLAPLTSVVDVLDPPKRRALFGIDRSHEMICVGQCRKRTFDRQAFPSISRPLARVFLTHSRHEGSIPFTRFASCFALSVGQCVGNSLFAVPQFGLDSRSASRSGNGNAAALRAVLRRLFRAAIYIERGAI